MDKKNKRTKSKTAKVKADVCEAASFNPRRIRPIRCPYMYDIVNGFTGMQRDLILRLCFLFMLRCKPVCVRLIIGMCVECLEWRKKDFFRNSRTFRIIPDLCTCSSNCYIPEYTSKNQEHCEFSNLQKRSIFVKTIINQGIFRLTIKMNLMNEYSDYSLPVFSNEYQSSFFLGTRPSDLQIPLVHDWKSNSGSCAFRIDRHGYRENGNFWSRWLTRHTTSLLGVEGEAIDGVVHVSDKIDGRYPLTLEVDADCQNVYLLDGGRKIPHAFARVHTPLLLGLSGLKCESFVIMSFVRVPAITPCPVVCRFHQCKQKKENS